MENSQLVDTYWSLYDPYSGKYFHSYFQHGNDHGIRMQDTAGEVAGAFVSHEVALRGRENLLKTAHKLTANEAATLARLQPVHVRKTVTVSFEYTIHWITDDICDPANR